MTGNNAKDATLYSIGIRYQRYSVIVSVMVSLIKGLNQYRMLGFVLSVDIKTIFNFLTRNDC